MKQKASYHLYQSIIRVIGLSVALAGCSTAPTATQDNSDPWAGWNHSTHNFNKGVDDAILKPLAKGYQNVVPNPVDESITNIFSNINDINVTINDFLQFKFLQGGMDASRFIINTTAGLVGIFDVAKAINLPKHNEDFGQTLGFWGIPSGNYLVLPFLGASSPRDTVGLIGDALLNPLTYVSLFGGVAANVATSTATVVDIADTRSDLMSSEKILDEASINRYDFEKNAYQQRREFLIYDGNPPEDTGDPLLDDDTGSNGSGLEPKGNELNPAIPSAPKTDAALPSQPNAAPIINNSTTLPNKIPTREAPVIDNSKHLLDLSAPDD